MTRLKTKPNRILKAVHETATDMAALGFIDKRSMRRYDALCLDPIPAYSAEQIRVLRERYRISQAVLAAVLNVSISTVQKWEINEKHPGGASLKLLNLLERKGIETLL
jgi:putative transcriptional regulator